jgi:hypothetical protein
VERCNLCSARVNPKFGNLTVRLIFLALGSVSSTPRRDAGLDVDHALFEDGGQNYSQIGKGPHCGALDDKRPGTTEMGKEAEIEGPGAVAELGGRERPSSMK